MKNLLKNKSAEEIFSILLFLSCVVAMVVLAVFRFCGIGYFANTYEEHTLIPWLQDLILFLLKWLEGFFILKILCTQRTIILFITSFAYTFLYFFPISDTTVFLIDVIFMTAVPFIISRFDYKRITYGLLLIIILSIYQFIMMQARYSIDLDEKFNYIAGIASVFDYKIFIISIYLLIYNRRISMKDINTPNPNEERGGFNGGHCFLFWGKFEKFCEVVGKIVVGVCTLGIAPLCVYLYRKKKNEKAE